MAFFTPDIADDNGRALTQPIWPMELQPIRTAIYIVYECNSPDVATTLIKCIFILRQTVYGLFFSFSLLAMQIEMKSSEMHFKILSIFKCNAKQL